MQIQTSLSPNGATCTELKGRRDASLVSPSPEEPLNSMLNNSLSSVHIGEGKQRDSGHEDAIVSRVPVVSANGAPLMPCKPGKARKLLEAGKAVKAWSKLGMFYLRLKFTPLKPSAQLLAVGVDPGSKFEGISVVGAKDTILNIMFEAVTHVKKAVETRRIMRRARRYRNTRRRQCRFNNRLSNRVRIPPSTKARWNAKLRIVKQIQKILPIQIAAVEDVKAETRKKNQVRWNSNFSPLEAGKRWFYRELQGAGLNVVTRSGIETQAIRESLKLKKLGSKSRPVFETHCVDAWCLAASVTGAAHPTAKSLYYLVPLRWHRRQLHRLEPGKGGKRGRYGGTMSLGVKKGTLVKHVKYGLCYIGGNLGGRFSLHSAATGKRLTQNAEKGDFRILTRIAFRSSFRSSLLLSLKGHGFSLRDGSMKQLKNSGKETIASAGGEQ